MIFLLELKGKEITVNDFSKKAYLCYRKGPEIELDIVCVLSLIRFGILEEDSGCEETGETHFYLSVSALKKAISFDKKIENIDKILDVIRDIKITKLLST